MSIIGHGVYVGRRPNGTVRLLRHNQAPYRAADLAQPVRNVKALAAKYVADASEDYEFASTWLTKLNEPSEPALRTEGVRLNHAEDKTVGNLRATVYRQSYLGLPIWQAGLSVRADVDRLSVLSSSSTVHLAVEIDFPGPHPVAAVGDGRRTVPPQGGLMVASEDLDAERGPKHYEPDLVALAEVLDASAERDEGELSEQIRNAKGENFVVSSTRPLIYQYRVDERLDPSHMAEPRELLPILAVDDAPDSIQDKHHYLVTELMFTASLPGWGEVHWRGFWEVSTGTLLYLRAFVSGVCVGGVCGQVWIACPARLTGDATAGPCDTAADLDPLRSDVTLEGLTAPVGAADQELKGAYIEILDTDTPVVQPPSRPPGVDFDYAVHTDDFAATSAYHHLDQLYRMIDDWFGVASYFNPTTFPVSVDHRGESSLDTAHHYHNGGGSIKYTFGMMSTNTGCTVGMAADPAVVIHEFGHSCLSNNLGNASFSWAHGIGDSLAVILLDPESSLNAAARYVRSPFFDDTNGPASRRHDRAVGGGWGWGGTEDDGPYKSTQILSTSLFRAYQATGGDENHADLAIRKERRFFAARYMTYLITGAVGSMSAAAPPGGADELATAMISFDQANADFEGHPGGAFHKVIRWAFEKQGLYQPPGAPTPVTGAGAPPDVDVYIDDGRNGEYEWRQNFWNTTDIWNQTSPGGAAGHVTPILNEPNYFYVRIRNRGSVTATNVTVRAYHCRPGTGLVWPDDWEPMDTAELSAADLAPNGSDDVGPFTWTPTNAGHECLLASVSATGDESNADTVNGPIPHWRLVPFDNNIAQRNVAPVPGSADELVGSLTDRSFWVNNPYDRTVDVVIEAELPSVLADRDWSLRVTSRGTANFALGPRGERLVEFSLLPGSDFDLSDIADGGSDVDILVSVDGRVVGGMTYRLDPEILHIPPERLGNGCCAGLLGWLSVQCRSLLWRWHRSQRGGRASAGWPFRNAARAFTCLCSSPRRRRSHRTAQSPTGHPHSRPWWVRRLRRT